MESSQGSGFDILVPIRMPRSPGINSDVARRQSHAPSKRTGVFARLLKPGRRGPLIPGYYPVPVRWICRPGELPFDVYGKDSEGEVTPIPGREHLPDPAGPENEAGGSVVYLKNDSRAALLCYLDENLEETLANPELSDPEKAELFYYLAYRRLRAAFTAPEKNSVSCLKKTVLLMTGHVLANKAVMKQVFLIMQDNGRKGAEHPEGSIMHSLDVGILSTLLVKESLPHLDRQVLTEAAIGFLFHDIGMMRLASNIVNHTGPLAEDVWPLVRQHPCWGLEDMEKARCASPETARIITGHHERLDGKGYPNRMKNDDLHFFVKVCSTMDAFDAMISRRPYRKALPAVEALKAIHRGVPGVYDAAVFSRLMRVFPDYGLI